LLIELITGDDFNVEERGEFIGKCICDSVASDLIASVINNADSHTFTGNERSLNRIFDGVSLNVDRIEAMGDRLWFVVKNDLTEIECLGGRFTGF